MGPRQTENTGLLYPPLHEDITHRRVDHRELGPCSSSWLPGRPQPPMDLMGSCWQLAQVVPKPWPSDRPYMIHGSVSCGDGQALKTTVLPGFEGPTNALKSYVHLTFALLSIV